MDESIGQQFGNYRLLKCLGRGGFADVYIGEHIHLGTYVAIKILHLRLLDSNRDAFFHEARILAQLNHPAIVRILDFGLRDTIPYLIMDYAPNGTLRQHFLKGTPLAPETLFPFMEQSAAALQYAHDHKLIHRDVKPENMLLSRSNSVLLSDFGLVLSAQSSNLRTLQEVAGTTAYMAPEQLQGKPLPASDQYALGIVVYEWLTGSCPFHGTFFEVASQHMFVEPRPLREKIPHISPQIENVVLTALSKDPRQRFASVQIFAKALLNACQLDQRQAPAYGRPAQQVPDDAIEQTYLKPGFPPVEEARPHEEMPASKTMPPLPTHITERKDTPVPVDFVPPPQPPARPPIRTARSTTGLRSRKMIFLFIGLVVLVLIGSVGALYLPARNWILAGGASPTASKATQPACVNTFNDQFNGPALNSAWLWDAGKDGTYAQTSQGLTVTSPPGTDLRVWNMAAPRVLRTVTGNFTASVLTTFMPTKAYQGAGIILWQDENNFIRLEHGYARANGVTYEYSLNGKYVRIADTFVDNNPARLPPNVTGVELRLQRHGNTFSAWMRQPNSDWQHINDSEIPFRTNLMIGLLVVNTEDAGSPITATFSNFQMSCQ